MSENSLLQEAYRNSNHDLRFREINTAYIVALILMPLGLTMDYVVYREQFVDLSIIRLISVLIILSVYLVYKKYQNIKYILFFENSWSFIIIVTLCAMIYITGGLHSSYYAALNLVIIGSTLLLPLSLKNATIIFIYTFLSYTFTVLLHSYNIGDGYEINKKLFNNLYFITLTGVIGATASYVKEKQRFREFSLRYELNKRNKELAELDKMKSNFFANISHELRTPLTLIISPIEDILNSDQPLDFRLNKLLTTVKENSYRLLKLVNDLLSVIRLDQQGAKLDCKPIDVKPLLRSIIHSVQHLASKQRIRLNSKIDFEPAFINGETSALEKIFINLLNNSIKFTPADGEVYIETQHKAGIITIIFKDSGIGISKKDLPFVFDRFKQADSSATRKYQGTGLGLSLVREMTHAMKGEISIQSEPNQGTCITLIFPLMDANQLTALTNIADLSLPKQDQITASALEHIHQKADYSLSLNQPDTEIFEPPASKTNITPGFDERPKLLIVDDEPELRAYLVNTLSNSYQVISAADGESGLKMATKYQPDLILLDLMLPRLDGLQLCEIIKNRQDLQFCKIILLTARVDEESKISALTKGADDFLTKPFSTIEIKTRLANLLKSSQLEKRLDQHNKQLTQALEDLKAIESKLIHSEKLSAVGSLAAGLLHEINNPLNYASTAIQLLQRDPAIKNDSDLKEVVEDIFEGMERIRIIVKDLRTFAYPGNDDLLQSFNLTEAITSSLRFTASEHKSIKIVVDVEKSLSVRGSQNHIIQVFINLITNACKALTEKELPEIIISTRPFIKKDKKSVVSGNQSRPDLEPGSNSSSQPDDEKRIVISICDNGSGISEADQLRIFEPFYTTRDVGEGLGMGLSICHTIIKNHSGSIEVSSEVGKYTEFSFDLALA